MYSSSDNSRFARPSSGGNPNQFKRMASELFGNRSNQGKGKSVEDKTSFSTSGNPKEYLDMATELRRRYQQPS